MCEPSVEWTQSRNTPCGSQDQLLILYLFRKCFLQEKFNPIQGLAGSFNSEKL